MSETTTAAPDGRSPVRKRPPSALSAKLKTAFNRFRGVPVETDLAAYARTVRSIRAAHEGGELAAIADAEIARRAAALRRPPADGASVPPSREDERVRVAIFALALEAARRATGLDAHDVQIIAGLAMTDGRIAELPTGEGKTLAAVFSASYFALLGRPVHVLTFNDYLARRDAVWMGPAYRLLGLSVGAVQEALDKAAKKAAYACDITYATAKEAGFDYLRDRLAYEPGELVHRPFAVALVDEADSILIDEARIPLVISGTSGAPGLDVSRLAAVVRDLERGRDFETDAENANVFPTDAGIRRVESALGCGNLFTPENETLLAAVHCALHAELLLERDVDYIVRDGRIEIVDEFTGRVMDKRHWPDGLQAAVEAKEGVRRGSEGRILGSITLQHFFRLYPTLCGMTATAEPSARELKEFYGLGVVVVPSHRPCVRRDLPDVVFTHREARRTALVREIAACRAAGRPVLVGTSSVRESEELAAALAGAGVPGEVLNAKNDELEAGIIARAGVPGAVTISTNMAGRGTDIKLGGPNVRRRRSVTGWPASAGSSSSARTGTRACASTASSAAGPAARAIPARRGSSSASKTTSSSATGSRAGFFPATGSSEAPFPSTTSSCARRSSTASVSSRAATWTSAGRSGIIRRSSKRRDGSSPAGATRSSLPTGERPVRLSEWRRSSRRPGPPSWGGIRSSGSSGGPRSTTSTAPGPTTWPGWPTSARGSTSSPSGGRSRSRNFRRPRPTPSSSSRTGSGARSIARSVPSSPVRARSTSRRPA